MKKKTTFLAILCIIIFGWVEAQTLIAHYNFDNSLNDETSTYNLSASSGFTPTFVTGQDGTANGAVTGFASQDFLSTASNFEIDGSEPRTMAAWINANSLPGSGQAIVGLGEQSQYKRWTYGTLGVRSRIEINGKGFNVPSPDFVTGVWYHVAVTFDGTTAKLYVNGELKQTNTTWAVVNTTSAPLKVGNDYNAVSPALSTRGFQGAIDDLRIYTGAANDAFILSLYNNTVLSVNNRNDVSTFKAFPNPVKNRLYFSSNEIASVEIYNLLGAKVIASKVSNGIDMSQLKLGIYLLKCFNSNNEVVGTIKITKN
ncbi:T9SS type A sorting domain-containing protein [Tamlana sp. 62-3]|uniref:T9SS type A sorting domain-containing protein n=1 Tax=Neotamlana sargassicola TaxID=2883125 RepID=A0A9X1L6L3_9FLAO|nr:LamG-like jellyroll fold domain-containing protein [Tamlana sargassicola]MCB4807876.1 T9SS type A sorting domain-containing protein [Tamlana sargassicola]